MTYAPCNLLLFWAPFVDLYGEYRIFDIVAIQNVQDAIFTYKLLCSDTQYGLHSLFYLRNQVVSRAARSTSDLLKKTKKAPKLHHLSMEIQ